MSTIDDNFPHCTTCNTILTYSFKYDAMYCSKCNTWDTPRCPAGLHCVFCDNRPETPLPKKEED